MSDGEATSASGASAPGPNTAKSLWDFLKNSRERLKELQMNIDSTMEARVSLKTRVNDFNNQVEEEARRVERRQSRVQNQLNLLELPDDTLSHILMFCEPSGICRIGRTCSRFRELVMDDSLWKEISLIRWGSKTTLDGDDLNDMSWRDWYANRYKAMARAVDMFKWLKKYLNPSEIASQSKQKQLLEALKDLNSFIFHRDTRSVDDIMSLGALESVIAVLQNRSESIREEAALVLTCLSLNPAHVERIRTAGGDRVMWKCMSNARSDGIVRNLARALLNVSPGRDPIGTMDEIFSPRVDANYLLPNSKYLGIHYYGTGGGSDGMSYMDIGIDEGDVFGFGWDEIGRFEITGSYSCDRGGNRFSFTKSYGTASSGENHVMHTGFWDSSVIFGQWEVSHRSRGFFCLSPITEEEFFKQEDKFCNWNSIQNIVAHWDDALVMRAALDTSTDEHVAATANRY